MFRRDRSAPLGRGPRPLLEAAHHAVRLGGLGRRGLDFVLLPDDGGALPAAHRRDRGGGPGRPNGLCLDGLQMEMARVEVIWFILKTEQLDAPPPATPSIWGGGVFKLQFTIFVEGDSTGNLI